jgi:hypothetical protein
MVQFMQASIGKCIKSHRFCELPTSTFAPTRLLEISDKSIPRLISTVEGFHEKYAALSYCWGKDEPLKTLSSNIKKMMDGISLEEYVTY